MGTVGDGDLPIAVGGKIRGQLAKDSDRYLEITNEDFDKVVKEFEETEEFYEELKKGEWGDKLLNKLNMDYVVGELPWEYGLSKSNDLNNAMKASKKTKEYKEFLK